MDWLNKATKSGWPEDLKEAKPTSEIGKSPARPRQSREITKVSFRHESVIYFIQIKTAEEIEAEAKKKEEQRVKKENNRKVGFPYSGSTSKQ